MSALDDFCTTLGQPFHEADDATRAAMLRRLADTTLYLALAGDPRDDAAEVLRLGLGDGDGEGEGGEAALACDDDGRLAAVLGRPVAHLALPGRDVARLLAEEGLALLVNPDAPSAMLLDGAALGWLARALAHAPAEDEARLDRLGPPDPAVVAALAPALGMRLADRPDLVTDAVLVAGREADGRRLHLVVLRGTPEDARPALARAVAELIAFMPPLPVPVDVSFADDLPLPRGAVTIRLEPLADPAPAGLAPSEPRPPRLR